jgi:hypothetical protein
MSYLSFRGVSAVLVSTVLAICGCGGNSSGSVNSSFTISPGTATFDTNCTGCNATNSTGRPVEQFKATLVNGEPASVTWSVTAANGSDTAYSGKISETGQYTPTSYLNQDSIALKVWATNGSHTTSAPITVTPGFFQPILPASLSLGSSASATITAVLAEAGGTTGINFALSNTSSGSSGGTGALSGVTCQRGQLISTICTVTYTAPANIAANSTAYVVATIGTSASKASAQVLLNSDGIISSPLPHQTQQLQGPVQLGSSGGNALDLSYNQDTISGCCSGTLGALLKDSDGSQYLLSNNHVLARRDQASVGESILQPGLIDNNCSPYNPGVTPVGSLTGFVPLSSSSSNVDAAIARVVSGAVDPSGRILELGAKQSDGSLAAAPPGISSTGGNGETGSLQLQVAKSGRTTGLTCANISALDLDIQIDYYTDCAETHPYLTKRYSNQLAMSGNEFSDAGDSGALVVDTANAEPVGLLFTGGVDAAGVGQAVANPVSNVLSELSSKIGGGSTTYTFVGTEDHAVMCLNYGDSTVIEAQTSALSDGETERAEEALAKARLLVNQSAGILGVATGKSNDHAGEAAVIIYVDETLTGNVPITVGGVRTQVIFTNAYALTSGTAPQTTFQSNSIASTPTLTAAALDSAVAVKQQYASSLMKQNPAFFGVGIGQSTDNPREASLVIYVDRQRVPDQLPETVGGLRTRYVIMDRMHVTRSYAGLVQTERRCALHSLAGRAASFDPLNTSRPMSRKLN